MKLNNRWALLGAVAVMSAATVGGPLLGEAQASKKGRRNTAIAAGAVTAYGLLKGNKTVAIAGGLGTAYAYKRYRDAKKSERRQTIGRVFGNRPVYDSRGNRYGRDSQFNRNQTYYNAGGRRIG